MKVRKAVFPVAGFGTRMLPATKAIPKEMLTLIDRPIIQYAVEEALEAGIEQIIFVTGRTKKAVEDHFDFNIELNTALKQSGKNDILEEVNRVSTMADIVFVRQKEQLGLGHAVFQAKDIVGDEPFAVILPDDIFLAEKGVTKQLVEQYEKTGGSVIALQEVPEEHTGRYGIVKYSEKISDRLFKLETMVEKPKENPPSNMAIIGRYILSPDVMETIGSTGAGALGEIQLTDAICTEAVKGNVHGYRYEGRRFDCGNRVGYLEAVLHFAAANPETKKELPEILRGLGL